MVATNHGLSAKAAIASGGQSLPSTEDAYETEYNVQKWKTPVKTEQGQNPFKDSKGDWQSGFTVPIPTGSTLTHTPQGIEKVHSQWDLDYFSKQFHEDPRKSLSAIQNLSDWSCVLEQGNAYMMELTVDDSRNMVAMERKNDQHINECIALFFRLDRKRTQELRVERTRFRESPSSSQKVSSNRKCQNSNRKRRSNVATFSPL